jgi:hypothetical protein
MAAVGVAGKDGQSVRDPGGQGSTEMLAVSHSAPHRIQYGEVRYGTKPTSLPLPPP